MSAAAKRDDSLAAQESALQMIYALELGGQDAGQIERWYLEAHPLSPAVRERAGVLLDAAVAHQGRIEELIRRHARGWRLERISVIDRSLLKLAIAELLLPQSAPLATVIHATLRLGKKFSQPGALNFLHGLLEAVAREINGEAVASAPASK